MYECAYPICIPLPDRQSLDDIWLQITPNVRGQKITLPSKQLLCAKKSGCCDKRYTRSLDRQLAWLYYLSLLKFGTDIDDTWKRSALSICARSCWWSNPIPLVPKDTLRSRIFTFSHISWNNFLFPRRLSSRCRVLALRGAFPHW